MGISKRFLGAAALSAGLAFASGASAGIIPYPDVGTVNPAVYNFTAASTGRSTSFLLDQAPASTRISACWSTAHPQDWSGLATTPRAQATSSISVWPTPETP